MEGVGWTALRKEGILGEIHCESWNGFVNFLNEDRTIKDKHHFYFRGHASEHWKLEPTLKRRVNGSNVDRIKEQTLSTFKKYCLGRRGHHPAVLNDTEWWALGQHYGLNTPLLDWSESPYISAFFAFNDADLNEGDENVAIWMLSKKINDAPGVIKQDQKHKLKFIYPYLDENARLINQRGLFIQSPNMTCIADWALNNIEANFKKILLSKILIPKNQMGTAIDSLDKMNINEFTLFPDISGAGRYANYIAKRNSADEDSV